MTAVTVNGAAWHTADRKSIAEVVDEWCPSPKGVAVALNGEVVPRSAWSTSMVADGDQVEIVTAAAGG